MPKTTLTTLPLFEALDYLYKNGLTIDKLWVTQIDEDKPVIAQTAQTTRPLCTIALVVIPLFLPANGVSPAARRE